MWSDLFMDETVVTGKKGKNASNSKSLTLFITKNYIE